jgi:hypothetical protein
MKLAVICLLAFAALAGTLLAPASARLGSPCAPEDSARPVKPSSFAPQGHSGTRVYGAPIQSRILTRAPKKPRTPGGVAPPARSAH